MPKLGMVTEQERQRRLRRISVTQLARLVGYSHSYVSLVESGKLSPSARYRNRVARAIGVPESAIFPEAK